jgi:hypothetical protein
MHIEMLVEDQSGKAFLDIAVERMISIGHTFRVHPVLWRKRKTSDIAPAPGLHIIKLVENQYVIDGLRVKLAEIQAAIRAGEQRLVALANDKDIITRALAIMGSDTAEGAVSLGIASGAFSRTILEVIRDASQPMTVRDMAGVLAKRAGRPLDKRELELVVARVRNAMPRLSDKLDGELQGRTVYWRVKAT